MKYTTSIKTRTYKIKTIYFYLKKLCLRHRFGLVNAINTYSRLKFVLCGGIFVVLIEHELNPILICICITEICVCVLLIHKGYFVVKKLILNVIIKAFW